MIIPALLAIPVAPLYLLSTDMFWIAIGFVVQGMCGGGGMQGQMPPYLAERFPTEVRATASAFCFHQGAIWGGFVPLVLTYFATQYNLGYAIPMMIGTCAAHSASPFLWCSRPKPKARCCRRISSLPDR